jgi:hypothetical protein
MFCSFFAALRRGVFIIKTTAAAAAVGAEERTKTKQNKKHMTGTAAA